MGLRSHVMTVALVVLPLCSAQATVLKAVPARDMLPPHHSGHHSLAVPVSGRTVVTTPHLRHSTSQHTKQTHRSSRQAQQYYQPAQQYYQWQQH